MKLAINKRIKQGLPKMIRGTAAKYRNRTKPIYQASGRATGRTSSKRRLPLCKKRESNGNNNQHIWGNQRTSILQAKEDKQEERDSIDKGLGTGLSQLQIIFIGSRSVDGGIPADARVIFDFLVVNKNWPKRGRKGVLRQGRSGVLQVWPGRTGNNQWPSEDERP